MSCSRPAVLLGLLCLASSARAEDLAKIDQVRFLYGGQMSFTPDGYPVVPIGIADRRRDVTLSAASGVRVMPDGPGGAEIRAGTHWTVRAEGSRPARLAWSVVLERLVGAERAQVGRALARWRERGEQPRVLEAGSLFGVKGVVLDRRAVLILGERQDSEAGARARAEALAKKWQIDARVHEELLELPRGTLVATASGSNPPIEVRNPGVLWFAPGAEGERLFVAQVEFGGVGDKAHTGREDRGYVGKIYVTLDKTGTLAVVNAVPSNQLLAGLVPAEMFPRAPLEALKAQAVAARTELLAKIGARHLTDPYRVCSTQHCQVYAGAGKETPRTTQAVVQTRGEVLFRAGQDDLVEAYYSASCGGHSEHNDHIWPETGKDATLRGHLDLPAGAPGVEAFRGGLGDEATLRRFLEAHPAAYCAQPALGKDRYRWVVRRSAAELDRLLAPFGVGSIRALVPGPRGASGRMSSLTIKGERGQRVVRGDLKVRQALGVRSTMFVIDVEGGEYRFSGGGFGHGVGLCQVGAIGMAEAGLDYRAILQHYYTGSRIGTLY